MDPAHVSTKSSPGLARRLGLFDATMIVMGGIVGSGIFMNPYVVARQVRTPFLILAVWVLGGVRAGSTAQSILMVLKIAAIAALVLCGMLLGGRPREGPGPEGLLDRPFSLDLVTAIGAAMVPVLFAYGGWQTACFVAGEVKDPGRTLPRGLLIGVSGVVVLYLSVNFVCLKVLGTSGLAGLLPRPLRTSCGRRWGKQAPA